MCSDKTENNGAGDSADNQRQEQEELVLEIFRMEAAVHLAEIKDWLGHAFEVKAEVELTDDLRRALHTLKGSASMADVFAVAKLADPLELFVKKLLGSQVNADQDIKAAIKLGELMLTSMIEELAEGSIEERPELEVFIKDLKALEREKLSFVHRKGLNQRSATHPEFIQISLSRSMDSLLNAIDMLAKWQESGQVSENQLMHLAGELGFLRQAAIQANLMPIAELCEELENAYVLALEDKLSTDKQFFAAVRRAQNGLLDCLDQIAAGQQLKPDNHLQTLQRMMAKAQ